MVPTTTPVVGLALETDPFGLPRILASLSRLPVAPFTNLARSCMAGSHPDLIKDVARVRAAISLAAARLRSGPHSNGLPAAFNRALMILVASVSLPSISQVLCAGWLSSARILSLKALAVILRALRARP